MSPIAPRLSWFDVVPSLWIRTSLSCGPALEVLCEARVRHQVHLVGARLRDPVEDPVHHRPATDRKELFGIESVSGRKRSAYPAARISAFIRVPRATARRAHGERRAR